MKRLAFIKILRSPADEPRLVSTDDPCNLPISSSFSEDESAQANDLSYEDAVVGLEVKHFLRAEYGNAQAPSDSFNKVLASIKSDERAVAEKQEVAATVSGLLARLSGALYSLAVGQGMAARVASGGVALAVILAVLSTNISAIQIWQNGDVSPSYAVGGSSEGVRLSGPQARLSALAAQTGVPVTYPSVQVAEPMDELTPPKKTYPYPIASDVKKNTPNWPLVEKE